MISLVPSESWGGFKWVRASARKWGVGPCPARRIWQGSGFAADQTNAMLATSNGGDKSSRKRKSLRLLGTAGFVEGFAIYSRETRCLSIWVQRIFLLAHSVILAFLRGGWYHYPWLMLHAVETLGAQELRRLICRFYATAVLALCGLNLPSSVTHATPTPNRAHSGSHAETRRVLRVDGDDVSGSGIIDTIDPFQADQTVAVALAEGHRNAVSP